MKKSVVVIFGLAILLTLSCSRATAAPLRRAYGISMEGKTTTSTIFSDAIVPAALAYVEGLNDDQPLWDGPSYDADWFGIEYTPTVSYDLKKVELMAGEGLGEFIVQLRPDSAGWPSDVVLRETSFNMVWENSWQGAEFEEAYPLVAGTTYWIVFRPIHDSQISAATSGTIIPHVWDYGGDGWDGKGTSFCWMARFYKEIAGLEGVKILFDGVHGWPGSDMDSYFSILHQDLLAAGATVDSLMSPPITSDILSLYDIYMVTEPRSNAPTPAELEAIMGFVAGGGGYLLIGDDDVLVYNEWVSFTNIFYAGGGMSGITQDITPHPVTEGVESLHFGVALAELEVVEQAVSLARVNGHTELAASTFGGGNVVVIADEETLIDDYINNEQNRLMASNAFVWLALGHVEFQYHFQIAPFINVIHLNRNPGGWLNGYMTGGVSDWNPVLGKHEAGRFYMSIDGLPDMEPGQVEMLFLVGTVATRTGQIIRTYDGLSYEGPFNVNLVPVAAQVEELQGPDITEVSWPSISPDAWYVFQVNPYADVVHLNTNPGGWLNGYDDIYDPDAPVLGFYEAGRFYFGVDGLFPPGPGYTMVFIAGRVSTRDGEMIRTADGITYDGPHYIWLTPT